MSRLEHCTLLLESQCIAGLAGHDEVFSSAQELLQCVRPGILLDAASVPSVQMTDRHGRVLPLNRYILDYWGHGQKQALVHANGLREGAPFHLIDHWARAAVLGHPAAASFSMYKVIFEVIEKNISYYPIQDHKVH